MTQPGHMSVTNHPRISIIGAGIAGLSLACRLSESRIPFTIYESRNFDSIGHSYGITLQRRAWRPLAQALRSPETAPGQFRQATAVDRLVDGQGRLSEKLSARSATFQAVDRDIRQWLVQHLLERGVQINWNHKLTSIEKAADGVGADLSFDGQATSTADIIVDTGGLRSPAFDHGVQSAPQPKLLPYATYYGTRRVHATTFLEKFAKFFRTGNTIELIPETPDTPFIYIQKVHLPNKSSQERDPNNHTVELRWLYSRMPKNGSDPLYRPQRAPEEAKNIPSEFYHELVDTIKECFSGSEKHMLSQFFTLTDLHEDRILNWHLRLRLPEQDYFLSNTSRSTYQVIAIGDAAHGLPIVQSNGANIAMRDAKRLSQWLRDISATSANRNISKAKNFYSESEVFRHWFRDATDAVQSLRRVHGQDALTEPQLKDTVGFWIDIGGETMDISDESELSDEEGPPEQQKGHL